MKKFFAVLLTFTLVFASCYDFWTDGDLNENNNNNSDYWSTPSNDDVIGTWTGKYGTGNVGVITLIIADDTWIMTFMDSASSNLDSYNGWWSRSGNSLTIGSSSAILNGNKLIVKLSSYYTNSIRPSSIELTKGTPVVDIGGTTLKIQNDSFSEITDVRWSDSVAFTQGTESIKNGYPVIKAVQEGVGYLYFKRKTNPINARTEMITIEKDKQNVIIINEYTPIVDVDNPSNKGLFGTLGVTREPQITVKAGASTIAQFGDYDFGGVLLNTPKDVTFTIGNSGKADLIFSVVEGNVINLSNNTSGYFSVNQQPFASMTIAPGSTTTFVIRFSPITVGNNFNAEVTIKTNSENNAEFTFRVKGNGSNEYKIGDTGPGGGMIFYAQGGQYKECSGELGSYDWNTAVTTARNYKGNGFSNWHLPDKGELDLMYLNLHKKGLGGFLNEFYWSSTESSSGYAWYYYFGSSSSSQNTDSTYYTKRVRAVRSFTL